MFAVSLNHQPIPGREMNGLDRIEKRNFSLSLEDNDPFVVRLVKAKTRWRDLAGGDDAFDAE
jgi:hypothetical protein